MFNTVGLILNAILMGSILLSNVTIFQKAPYYFPNCNLVIYYWLNNNLINFTKIPIEIYPFSSKTYSFSFNLEKYRSGNLSVEAYISCERLNLYGNHIAFQGGIRKTLAYNGKGEIPKAVIDKDETRIVGARGQAGPKIEPGKRIYLDIDVKALDNFEGKLIINLCKWDNVIYRNTCKKVYEKEIKLNKGEEKMYRIYLNFPKECDAYNYEILLVDNKGNIHDIWTLRGVTKCLQLHYVYTYFTPEGYSVIFTGPYDPNWGYASGKIKIVSENYSKEFDVKLYTNQIVELKDNIFLKNFCIYLNNTLIKCNNYNLTKFENRLKKINETIKRYLKMINKKETNVTKEEIIKKGEKTNILWYIIGGIVVLALIYLISRKIRS